MARPKKSQVDENSSDEAEENESLENTEDSDSENSSDEAEYAENDVVIFHTVNNSLDSHMNYDGVHIKRGENKVTPEQLEILRKNDIFNLHCTNGFVTV